MKKQHRRSGSLDKALGSYRRRPAPDSFEAQVLRRIGWEEYLENVRKPYPVTKGPKKSA